MQALIQQALLFRIDTEIVPSGVDTGVGPLDTDSTLVAASDVDTDLVLSDADLVVASGIDSGLAVPFRSDTDLVPTYPWLQYAK